MLIAAIRTSSRNVAYPTIVVETGGLLYGALLMRIFKLKPSPMSDEDIAAADRLRRITARRGEMKLADTGFVAPTAIESQRKAFWTPEDLSAACQQ